ncbi:MAG TPA: ABC transporter permease [Firmicutes bacterium]|nr:ABC transporter permease [Bacillota bacterium]
MTPQLLYLLRQATMETLWMVGLSTLIAVPCGLPLGVLLVCTEPGGILENRIIYPVLSGIVNVGRSIPFIILMVAIIPFTRLLVGTSIGTTAAVVPLAVAAIPFVARIVESSLKEIGHGVIEAAQAMGATPWQIICKVLIPEALPALVLGTTITTINLVGYSAMAGAIGGGGLGDLAIRYGYQRFRTDVMLMTVAELVLMVQGIQMLGDWLARKLDHK